jgi:hypothetical protein
VAVIFISILVHIGAERARADVEINRDFRSIGPLVAVRRVGFSTEKILDVLGDQADRGAGIFAVGAGCSCVEIERGDDIAFFGHDRAFMRMGWNGLAAIGAPPSICRGAGQSHLRFGLAQAVCRRSVHLEAGEKRPREALRGTVHALFICIRNHIGHDEALAVTGTRRPGWRPDYADWPCDC